MSLELFVKTKASKINKKSSKNWSWECPGTSPEPPGTGPAGLKTGPRRLPAAQSSQNHHKISSNRNRHPSTTSCNLPRHLWKRHRASWSLARMFLDRTLDSGLRTPDSFMSHNSSAVAGSPLCGALDMSIDTHQFCFSKRNIKNKVIPLLDI